MKTSTIAWGLSASLLGATASPAEVVITSADRQGNLTWTNAVSNASYRLEWAGAVTGPWQTMDALTNLALITATNTSVTVQVPVFYRVVWLDPPEHVGSYAYSGYDAEGALVVTGRLELFAEPEPKTGYLGRWDFQAEPGVDRIGPQVGQGNAWGTISFGTIHLNLNPGAADNNVMLAGTVIDGVFAGTWEWIGFFGVLKRGTFWAVKQNGHP